VVEVGRELRGVPAGLAEVLVAGRALLAVPALFVYQAYRCEQREALDGEGDVREVGDGAMAVLEVEGVEELLGALRADLGERLLHGERGARVLRHGVGEDLRVGAVDGVDVGL
jgi:hypothetical protein